MKEFKKNWLNTEEDKNWRQCVHILNDIDLNSVTILTGDNGSGKSLIRTQLSPEIKETIGSPLKHVSMALRTTNDPMRGALSGAMLDTQWIATSQNTYKLINSLFHTIEKDNKKHYICLDEFEIGCGEETILALINYINKKIENLKDRVGFLIITHSRLAVEKLNYDNFYNIQGLTAKEYINREILPTNLEKLEENNFFNFIRDLGNLTSEERSELYG